MVPIPKFPEAKNAVVAPIMIARSQLVSIFKPISAPAPKEVGPLSLIPFSTTPVAAPVELATILRAFHVPAEVAPGVRSILWAEASTAAAPPV